MHNLAKILQGFENIYNKVYFILYIYLIIIYIYIYKRIIKIVKIKNNSNNN